MRIRHDLICRLLFAALAITFSATAQAHDSVEEMSVAAERFLSALDAQQKSRAVYKMSDDERMNWHFVPDASLKPEGRRGLSLRDMTAEQRPLAHALLNAGLSHDGYLTAMTIVSLEQILHDLEQQNPIRDPALYYVTIFGTPGDSKAWGWRFEGHHLSVNFAIVGGDLVSVTPAFFGANPAVVPRGPRKGLQTLRAEEELARALVTSLSEEQKKSAVLSDMAPADIITGQQRTVDQGQFQPAEGIAGDQLDESQRRMLLQLIQTFAEKFRPEIVEQIDQRGQLFQLNDARFAWAGGLAPGEGHYYRVQTPKFLFEYDNTQNNANHVHTVWRDFDGDYGADLLREHYEKDHAGEAASQ